MNSLGWEIPTLFDVIILIVFNLIPILLLVSILIKIVLKHFLKQKYLLNIVSSVSPIGLGIILTFILGGFFSADIIIYLGPLLIIALLIFLLLQGLDKLLKLPRNSKLLIIFVVNWIVCVFIS